MRGSSRFRRPAYGRVIHMTLRLRRKRPTTAASSREAKSLDAPHDARAYSFHNAYSFPSWSLGTRSLGTRSLGTRQAPNFGKFGYMTALAGMLIASVSTTLAAEPNGLNWRKPNSPGAAAGSPSSASARKTTTKDPNVRQARANSLDVALAPVLNAANTESNAPRVARAGEGSVLRRPQAGRFTAQAE